MPEAVSLIPHLTVSRTPLVAAAKRLRKATTDRKLMSSELLLRYSDGDLMLEIPGAAEGVSAEGRWPGLLRVAGTVLLLLAKGELAGDVIELDVQDQHLRVRAGHSTLRFKGRWADISPSPLTDIPLDATDLHLLRMAAGQPAPYPPAATAISGLDVEFAAAERRFQQAVTRAHKSLKAYNIPRDTFEASIRALLLNRSKP